ncbi:hypothetical protein B0H15DRAFT_822811 [Mycena belliarum]|uniref:RING-type domain-containing protein n=1 Tax=Mycena belliarum TaxID=1033014 RepID=A0AAD6UFW0_9AGAR|nr:hypothetical protein B0H15DRAFT_822811 [Mycena belliae]
MSAGPVPAQEIDFWEFVSCSRCQLPFTSDSGATVPFWLTECGHVICNSHLSTDQSCAQCGIAGIQLVPLQREMELPMSAWFQSIPHALDAVAYAAKFQQETMAFQIQFYKARQQQQRAHIDRLKRDTAELKKVNSILAHENAQLRQHLGYPNEERGDQGPSSTPNSNGKRPMNDFDQYRPRSSSSRSTVTPLGPNRLTLPPGQQPPSLSSNRAEQEGSYSQSRPPAKAGSTQRPGSSRFAEQYAYMPPATPQFHSQQLSHTQAAPRRTKQNQNHQPDQKQSRATAPPARFRPPQRLPVSTGNGPVLGRPSQASVQNQAMHEARQRPMGPPPTPQQLRQQAAPPQSARRSNTTVPPDSNRFLPPSQRFAPPEPVDPQQFMPSAANGAPQRFVADSRSRATGPATSNGAHSRGAIANMSGGGQRVPFVPHAPGGFG